MSGQLQNTYPVPFAKKLIQPLHPESGPSPSDVYVAHELVTCPGYRSCSIERIGDERVDIVIVHFWKKTGQLRAGSEEEVLGRSDLGFFWQSADLKNENALLPTEVRQQSSDIRRQRAAQTFEQHGSTTEP